MQNRVVTSESTTPLLSDIPLVGGLFNQTQNSMVKSELVILLKASIVKNQTNSSELENIKSRFNQM